MGANYTVSEFCIIKGFYCNLTLKRHLNYIFSGKIILSTEAEGDQQLNWQLKALCCQMVTPNITHQRGNTVIHFEAERS